jgi:hypothetical protein
MKYTTPQICKLKFNIYKLKKKKQICKRMYDNHFNLFLFCNLWKSNLVLHVC